MRTMTWAAQVWLSLAAAAGAWRFDLRVQQDCDERCNAAEAWLGGRFPRETCGGSGWDRARSCASRQNSNIEGS
jgi:hypothetical protein